MTIRKEPLLCDYPEYSRTDIKAPENYSPPFTPRKKPGNFPCLPEPELVRHYYRLSRMNYSWDDGLYPLGSCTMKYNPILNEKIASNEIFGNLHPHIEQRYTQGAMEILHDTQEIIASILDLPAVSLMPAAGAHGELAGVFMIDAYFRDKGEKRSKILIPDSAHGTNPASAAIGGFITEKVPSGPDGLTDIEALKNLVDENTAALMITNPNTVGIFEKRIEEIKKILDEKGALLYIDGANLNAIMDIVSFNKMGADLTQLNLHKTFSTPHGGGGPGQGALGCSERMVDYLPSPIVEKVEENGKIQYKWKKPPKSIGPIKVTYGQFGVILRAWVYLKTNLGKFKEISERAVLNANYIRKKLEHLLSIASPEPSMHEAVFSQATLKEKGVTTKHLAKSLLDRGFYAPTIYFPLHVDGAMMIEPTETESKRELDLFIEAITQIFNDLETNRSVVENAPLNTVVRQIDEVQAARNPILTWDM